MSIFEYNEEQHLKSEREQAYKEGQDAGIELGRKEGEKRFGELMRILLESGKNQEIVHALSDSEYRDKLYLENNL